MKLLATAGAIVCAAALAVVAPALSAERWRPEPVDFELSPSPEPAAAASSGPVRSRPLRAPGRFNLVGLRWRGRAEPEVRLRVKREGRRWSRWRSVDADAGHNPDARRGEPAVAASDPVWVGEADDVQYRLSRSVPGLRLHFVNVAGTATPTDRARTVLRRAVSVAAGTVTGMLGTDRARAQSSQPAVVTRRQWGASSCKPREAPSYGTVESVHVHHTVSLSDYSRSEAPGVVLAICRYHRNSNGWNDIGYQALIDKYGVLYEGRAGGLDRPVLGAHAQGFNEQSTGIASVGDNTSVGLSDPALESLAGYIRWKLGVHGRPLTGDVSLFSAGGATSRYPAGRRVTVPRVLGHRDTNATACPGSGLYVQLEDLRSRVATGEPLPGLPTLTTATLSRSVARYGGGVELNGTLTSGLGAPLAAEQVRVQALRTGRWRDVVTAVTDATGHWYAALRPKGTRLLRATFAGRTDLRPSFSVELLFRVRPVLALDPTATRGTRGSPVRVPGRVTPRKRVVYQVLQQRIRGVYRKVGVRAVPVRAGRFSGSFTPAYSALYRVYVVAKPDAATGRGRSPARVVRVSRR